MALSDLSRDSLLPSFLYSASPFASSAAASRLAASSSYHAPAAAAPSPPAFGGVAALGGGGGKPFSINSPNEKIEMYSPAFYAACTAGGIASCGLTHMAVTPLDLVKCNMQVSLQICALPASILLSREVSA
jgi:solute carrier family 25 phosphate transporter 3